MVVRMPQLWSSHHCCGSWVVITILLKMVNAKDGGLLWDIPSFQLTEVRHGSNTYLFWKIIFYFFMYQWGSPTLGGVLVKLSRWEFQLPLTPASSCGGLLCLVQVEAYVRTDVLHPERSFYSCGLSDYSLRRTWMWQLSLGNTHEGSHGSNGVWIVVVV